MNQRFFIFSWLCCAGFVSAFVSGAEPATGWRGNGTGLWPDSTAPVKWNRIAHGAMEGLQVQANRPMQATVTATAPFSQKGLLNEWLILGPLAVRHSVENFDDDLLAKEAEVSPTAGDKTAGLTWQPLKATLDDPLVFGAADLPWVNLIKIDESKPHQVAYASTNVFSPRGGPIRCVIEHCFGLKAFINGQEVYRATDFVGVIGGYQAISRRELANSEELAGIFTAELKPGWNRLLLKLSTDPRTAGHKQMQFCLRLMDPPTVNYESQNIRWMTELPGRSTSTPIIVGDRVFLTAEPDLLVC
ncbi:MAG: hypothetical protein JWM11_1007, partial [Planctomycetaceae bacterium]|nr:hypothetical protein [Planctomycetaceae bacterium]